MTHRRSKTREPRPSRPWSGSSRAYLLAAVGLLAVAATVAFLVRPAPAASAWTRLRTADVHSLAFAPGSVDRLYFGHHNGVFETTDGGRTWRPLASRSDAMGMRPAADGSIVTAGHEVLQSSTDGGATWTDIASDLPNTDIHGFTRDPADGRRMWAYLATGGVYESTDGGTHWLQAYAGHIPFLFAYRTPAGPTLIGIDPSSGVATSADGGRTWTTISAPPDAPVNSLTATPDGRTVFIGGSDGLFRSTDGGRTWKPTALTVSPFAIAVSDDGRSVAVVSRATDFYRSNDGGVSWPGPT